MANGSITLDVLLDSAKLERGLANVGNATKAALGGVAKVSTAVAAAWGALETYSVKVGMEFESAMAQTATIMDKSVMNVEEMSEAISALSGEMGVSAASISGAVYNAISATGDTANAVSLVADATKLATAGFTDTDSALSVLTTSINAYGMAATDAGKISDSLIMTQNLGVTTVAQLSASMGKAIASASAYGVDLYNLESAYVSLTKGGINTAESTTYISAMMRELGSDSTEVSKLLTEKTGKSFNELMQSGSSLGDVLGVLYEAMGNDAGALMNLWSSAEAGKASNAIINQGLEAFNNNLSAIAGSAGTTEEAYETMCETLGHQTALLKTNFQNLGIGIYDALAGTFSEYVGFANNIMNDLKAGFDAGGLDGLTDAIAAKLPDIVSKLTEIISQAISSVAKWLPNAVKQLMSALPSALKSVTGLMPQLLSALMDGAGVLLREFVAQLPQLVPVLAQGIGDLFIAAINGIDSIVSGLFSGIGDALKALGVVDLNYKETLQAIVDQIDTSEFENYEFEIEMDATPTAGTVDPAQVKQALLDTYTKFKEALEASSLTSDQKDAVTKAVLTGSGIDLFHQALLAAGLGSKAVNFLTNSYKDAMTKISTTIAELDISPEAKAHLTEMVDNGATKEDIEAYLISLKVDPTVASDTATALTTAFDTVNETIGKLRVSPEVKALLWSLAANKVDRQAIEAYLRSLGFKDEELNAILACYDTMSGTVSGKMLGVFEGIKEAITNGKTETDKEVEALKGQVTEAFTSVYSEIEEARQAALKAVDKKGLTGEEATKEIEAVNAKFNSMTTEAKKCEQEALAYIEANAGNVTTATEAHLTKLDELKEKALATAAEIDALSQGLEEGALTPGSKQQQRRKLVESGMVSDGKYQEEAIALTGAEYDAAMQAAVDAKDTALANAIDKLTEDNDQAAYEASVEAALASYEEATTAAVTAFNEHMAAIYGGLLANAPEEVQAAIAEHNEKLDLAKQAEELLSMVTGFSTEGGAEGFSVDALVPELEAGGYNLDAIADAMGMTKESFITALGGAIGDADSATALQGSLADAATQLETEAANALADTDFTDALAPVKAAFEAGFLPENLIGDGNASDSAAILQDFIEKGTVAPIRTKTEEVEKLAERCQQALDIYTAVADFLKPKEEPQTQTQESASPTQAETENAQKVVEQANALREELKGAIEYSLESGEPLSVNDLYASIFADGVETDELMAALTETFGLDPETFNNYLAEQLAGLNENGAANDYLKEIANTYGALIPEGFASGISENADAGADAGKGLADKTAGGLKGVVSAFETLANNAADAFIDALRKKIPEARRVASEFTGQSVEGGAEGQDSHSPSRKTQKLGRYFVEGYTIGIQETTQNAIKAAQGLTRRTVGAIRLPAFDTSNISSSIDGAADALYSASERNIILQVNGRDLGRVMARDNAMAMSLQSRSVAMGVGKK